MYDAIVAGARCAGAPTAMLLARKGFRVLLVDRDTFPSDIMSTHYIHVPGIARLKNWGLLDRLVATGCPPITSATVHFGEAYFQPPPLSALVPGVPEATLCPRRVVLDKLLIDGAVESGAEFRESFSVQGLLWDDGAVSGVRGSAHGKPVEERARIVIGADGLHSRVARDVKPAEYNTIPSLTFAYYTYWTGVQMDGIHFYFFEDGRGILAFPTHWGQVCLGIGGENAGFREFRKDIGGNYMALIDRVPELAEQVRAGKQEQRFLGTADQPNYFRKPYGPGWALVGDAGYHRDFITGLGINDAFRDAELLTRAIDEAFSGQRPLDEAMADYENTRNDLAMPLYEITTKMASGELTDPTEFMKFGPAIVRNLPSMNGN
ncbi:MAG TPA: NAD(P)/FAD-dependent oxidoreductase [Dehalococcoidia bacterium]|nr:NAD(P)/FAD-dependent oxidoreductase [Dehalococcoidia bacterium]